MSENKSIVIPIIVAIVVGVGAAYISSMYFHSDIRKNIVAIKEQIQKMKESMKPTDKNPQISEDKLTALENKLMDQLNSLEQQQISQLTELRDKLRNEIDAMDARIDKHDELSRKNWKDYMSMLEDHTEQH